MKRLLLLGLLLATSPTWAATVGPNCSVAWDYPEAELARVDGFRLYLNGTVAATVPSTQQTVACSALALTAGSHTLEATAYNAVGESARSAPLEVLFVTAPPSAPINIHIQIQPSANAEQAGAIYETAIQAP